MWKVPPTCSLSPRRLQSVQLDHSRTEQQLNDELTRLDRQRQNTLRQLDHEARHFVQDRMRSARSHSRSRESSPCRQELTGSCSPERHPFDFLARQAQEEANRRSPSPRLPALSGESGQRSRSSPRPSSHSSPQQVRSRSPWAATEYTNYGKPTTPRGLDSSPTRLTNKHVPEEQKGVLPRRRKTGCIQAPSLNVSMTTVTAAHDVASETDIFVTHKTTAQRLTSDKKNKTDWIPQIVVSDSSVNLGTKNKSEEKEGHRRRTSQASGENNNSLSVQPQRSRSHSEPSLPGVDIAPLYEETVNVDSVPDLQRARSNSVCVPYFAHLKHSPRRQSLLEKYTVRPGLQKRTARTIQQLISELSRGIGHEELSFHDPRIKPISDSEWQELKKCRYLRMPSRREDYVKANTLDLDAIFSHNSD